jgi:hypothetical protein
MNRPRDQGWDSPRIVFVERSLQLRGERSCRGRDGVLGTWACRVAAISWGAQLCAPELSPHTSG